MSMIDGLTYEQKTALLDRLIMKRGELSDNLSFKEQQYYELLVQWYNANHRTA